MKVTILGAGAYALSLCSILENNKHDVILWTKFSEEKEMLLTKRNSPKLSKYKLGKSIKITTDPKEAVKNANLIVLAVPAAFVRSTLDLFSKYIKKDMYFLIATKGIEQETGVFINEIVEDYLSTKDIIGIEVCGALKNVIAIASGILTGLEENASTSAMFLTEAVHDMMEILSSFKGKRKTVISYAGIGDLLLTCSSEQSRNFAFGKLIGSGSAKKDIDKYLKSTTVEGYYTLESIYKLLKNKKVDIEVNPIFGTLKNK